MKITGYSKIIYDLYVDIRNMYSVSIGGLLPG